MVDFWNLVLIEPWKSSTYPDLDIVGSDIPQLDI
jgi:hypothetical protein